VKDSDLDGIRQAARQRAYRRLAAMYPGVFERLHNEERLKVGLDVVGEARIGRADRPDVSTDDIVFDYCKRGMTSAAIAEKHRCSTQTVLNRLRKAGVTPRPPGDPGWSQSS
jgi:hypothetical protein